jgi:hypothetical protein
VVREVFDKLFDAGRVGKEGWLLRILRDKKKTCQASWLSDSAKCIIRSAKVQPYARPDENGGLEDIANMIGQPIVGSRQREFPHQQHPVRQEWHRLGGSF